MEIVEAVNVVLLLLLIVSYTLNAILSHELHKLAEALIGLAKSHQTSILTVKLIDADESGTEH